MTHLPVCRPSGSESLRAPTRRDALGALGAYALAAAGCGSGTHAASAGACPPVPSETAGPFVDKAGMRGDAAFHRRDIREGRDGVPLILVLTVVDTACHPLSGYDVEIWHCDKGGVYSEYGAGAGATFLRGFQTSGADGTVTFQTVYPGWYPGRATHIHVSLYAAGGVRPLKTTQIAFPAVVNDTVNAAYGQGPNPEKNAADMVFADSEAEELAALSGDVTGGYTAVITFALSA